MNRQIPIMSKIISYGQLKRNYLLHENKIKNAKPTLTTRLSYNNSINNSHSNLYGQIKQNKIPRAPFGNSFNRMIDIQLQNKALLKKLTQKSKPLIITSRINSTQSQCKLINRNNKRKYYQEYQLQKENIGLLKRLKSTKPIYRMQKYASQRKTTERYINSISKFSYKGLKPNKTIIKFEMENNLAKFFQKEKQIMLEMEKNQNNTKSKSKSKSQEKQASEEKPRKSQIKQVKLPKTLHKNYEKIGNPSKFVIPSKQVVSQECNRKKYQKLQTNQKQQQKFIYSNNNNSNNNISTLKIQNNSSLLRRVSSHQKRRSASNSPQSNSLSGIIIPQKLIRINGKKFILKGKQYPNKLCLQILNCKNKSIGHDFIHQVEIPNQIYLKRFYGRIDVLIQHLKYDKQNQGFYLQ